MDFHIYIKTPLYKNANTVPHIIEHTIGSNPLSVEDFFSYFLEGDHHTHSDYSYFLVEDITTYEPFIQVLQRPIQREDYFYEKALIGNERKHADKNFWLYEKIVRKLSWRKIDITKNNPCSYQEVFDYHKKHYQLENIIICDKDYNILHEGFPPSGQQGEKNEHYFFKTSSFKTPYYVWGYQNYDEISFSEILFFYSLLETWNFYQERRYNGNYYFKAPLLGNFENFIWITVYQKQSFSVTKEFFENAKKYFLDALKKDNYKERILLNNYIYHCPTTKEGIKKHREAINWEKAQSFFQSFV